MLKKPNILFLMVDQPAPHFLPAYGHGVVKTPRLDEIATDSVVFDAHYCNSPLCVPSRAAMMTGRLPSTLDVFDSGCDFAWSTPTLAHYLRAGGYVTVVSDVQTKRNDRVGYGVAPARRIRVVCRLEE